MENRKIIGLSAVIAIAICCVGCGSGSSGGSDDNDLSETQADALSGQIADAAVNAMNSGNFAAMVSKALAGEDLPSKIAKTIQCNDAGCTINVPIDYGVNCTAGGRIAVTGSITGSTSSSGTGILQIGATETITDWECISGFIINGDPYISLSGTFSFLNGAPSTQQSLTISGGFKWGTTAAESCQIHLSTNFYTSGGGTTTGTICGYTVNESF
ncbi:MAG: hypothetical protein ABH859_03360 [Pseudomonadota bacterium]